MKINSIFAGEKQRQVELEESNLNRKTRKGTQVMKKRNDKKTAKKSGGGNHGIIKANTRFNATKGPVPAGKNDPRLGASPISTKPTSTKPNGFMDKVALKEQVKAAMKNEKIKDDIRKKAANTRRSS